jgi:hypothetical protein
MELLPCVGKRLFRGTADRGQPGEIAREVKARHQIAQLLPRTFLAEGASDIGVGKIRMTVTDLAQLAQPLYHALRVNLHCRRSLGDDTALGDCFNRFPASLRHDCTKRRRLRWRFGLASSDFAEEAVTVPADTANPLPPIHNLLEVGVSVVSQFVHFAFSLKDYSVSLIVIIS